MEKKKNNLPNSWKDCCWLERYIPSPFAEALQLWTLPSPVQPVHPERGSSYHVKPADGSTYLSNKVALSSVKGHVMQPSVTDFLCE